MKTTELNLDIELEKESQSVHAKQGDSQSRYVKVTLEKDGKPWKPKEGATAVFRALKPDGKSIFNPASIAKDGTVTVELTEQTLAVPGPVYADICITESGETGDRISTVTFSIDVERAPLGSRIESESEIQALIEMVKQGGQIIATAKEAEKAAVAAAEQAGTFSTAAKESETKATEAAKEAKRQVEAIDTKATEVQESIATLNKIIEETGTVAANAVKAAEVAKATQGSLEAADLAAKGTKTALEGVDQAAQETRAALAAVDQGAKETLGALTGADSAAKETQAAVAAADRRKRNPPWPVWTSQPRAPGTA